MSELTARRSALGAVLSAKRLLTACDLGGTAVFAVEGAAAAVAANLDLLGVLVLGFVTALAGGTVRDVLIGATPPRSIADWRYAAVALLSAAAYYFAGASLTNASNAILYLDAAGLGLFAVAGAQKSLAYGINPLLAIMLGGVTGAGGGVVRDVLLARVPTVLQADIYATAALAGAAVMVISRRCGIAQPLASGFGIAACFSLRVVGVWQHWNVHMMPRF